jgi:hypothetical protein
MAARKKATEKPSVKVAEAAVKTTAPKAKEMKAEVEKAEAAVQETEETKAPEEKADRKTQARQTPAKKAEVKSELHVQFSGKSYTQEDLLKIAKDVWKYDLKQKAGELKGVELYVKPEENIVYYVMNKEFTGSFYI